MHFRESVTRRLLRTRVDTRLQLPDQSGITFTRNPVCEPMDIPRDRMRVPPHGQLMLALHSRTIMRRVPDRVTD